MSLHDKTNGHVLIVKGEPSGAIRFHLSSQPETRTSQILEGVVFHILIFIQNSQSAGHKIILYFIKHSNTMELR